VSFTYDRLCACFRFVYIYACIAMFCVATASRWITIYTYNHLRVFCPCVGWVLCCIFSLVLIPYTPDRLWQMKRQEIASDTNPIQGTHVVFLPIYFAAFFSGRHQPQSHYTDSRERCQTSSYTAAWIDTRQTDWRKTKEELVDRQCSGGLCIVRQSGCWNAGTTSERAGRCVNTK